MQGADPVRIGLVSSLSRPDGNLTGINLFLAEVAGKRLQLLRETVPSAKAIAYLRNPTNPIYAESETKQVEDAVRALGVRLLWANASSLGEIDAAFTSFMQQTVDAVFVSADGFFLTNSNHIVALAARYAVPAIYGWRQAVALGGLMSYERTFPMLGGRPASTPANSSRVKSPASAIELVINLKTARTVGTSFPLSVLGAADEVIE